MSVRKNHALYFFALLFAFSFFHLSCAKNTSHKSLNTNEDTVVKQPEKKKEEKTLFVYTAFNYPEVKKILEVFREKTGVSVEYIGKSTGEIFKLLEVQKDNPMASVMYCGPAPFYIEAKKKGLIIPYKSPNASQIQNKFKDPQGYWTGVYTGVIGFATNTTVVKNPPKSWKDLLKPEYKGKIAMSNPYTSGTGYTILATLVQLMGEKKAFDYMKKLNKQVFQYPKGGEAPPALIKLGVIGVAICFAHDVLSVKEKGDAVVLTFPKEGTGWEIGAVALVKNAPQMSSAKKFIDLAISSEGQSIMISESASPRFPTNKKVTPSLKVRALKDVKLIDFDFEWAGEKREYLLEKWSKEVLKSK